MWSIALPRAKLASGRNSMRWKYTNVGWNVGVCGFHVSVMNCWRGVCAACVKSSAGFDSRVTVGRPSETETAGTNHHGFNGL